MHATDDDFEGLSEEERDDARRRLREDAEGPRRVISAARDVDGILRFRSTPLRVFAVLVSAVGVAGGVIQGVPLIGVAGLAIGIAMLLYGFACVQSIEVGADRSVAIAGLLRRDPVPLSTYRWIRCYSTPDIRLRMPSVLVCYRSGRLHPFAKIRARLRPSASSRRAVVFFQEWRDEQGTFISAHAMESVLKRAARGVDGLAIVDRSECSWTARESESG